MSDKNLTAVATLPLLPDYLAPDRGEAIPADILGGRIVGFGTVAEPRLVEGGGLVIDYVPSGESVPKRAVFAFNELGMWTAFLQGRV